MRLYQDVDYYIHFEDFPAMGVHGFVGSNQDGTASVYINTLYCERERKKTLRHELRHVALDHLWRDDMEEQDKEEDADDIYRKDVVVADDFSWVEVVECEMVS